MDKTTGIIDAYKRMAEKKVDADYLEELAKKLSRSRLPAKVIPSYLRADEAKEQVAAPETVWDVYNDITANIWHNDKTNMRIKIFHFDNLHRVLPLQVK